MNGYINLIKPPGMTSHDLVAAVRRLTGERRVGHAGTLDPAASGLMIVALGQGTRLMEYAVAERKRYRAEMILGIETDSHDTTGRVTARHDASGVTPDELTTVMDRFKGDYSQIPPMVSAVKIGGRRLYDLARQGREVERAPRQVHIYDLEMTDFTAGDNPVILLDICCSKGTYIRTLCHDIGAGLGCGAAMSFLVRTESGTHRIGDACTLHDLSTKGTRLRSASFGAASPEAAKASAALTEEDFFPFLRKIDGLAASLPAIRLDTTQAERFRHGMGAQIAAGTASGEYRVYEEENRFIGIAEARIENGTALLKPRKVMSDAAL
ncbi:MAG: tRNA pseudouridine(55) synthase TruB [bacterium]|nr:tRNA pseudouridine(55) synthase TruB [bacterium]